MAQKLFVILALALIGLALTSQPVFADENLLTQEWIEKARDGTRQPPLLLPWPEGDKWHFVSGPHGFEFAAIDFAPPSAVEDQKHMINGDCGVSEEWIIAEAPGIISTAGNNEICLDLDGDGNNNTGWVICHYHVADSSLEKAGTYVQPGDRLAQMDCDDAGNGNGVPVKHLHITRMFNGAWAPAADTETPLNFEGWTFESYGVAYHGAAVHKETGRRIEWQQWYDDWRFDESNAIESHNGPDARKAEDLLVDFDRDAPLRFRFLFGLLKPGNVVSAEELIEEEGFINGRLKGDNGLLLPVASKTLSSTEEDHDSRDAEIAWDLSAVQGAPVYAAASGIVRYAGCDNSGNYGCWVSVEHDDGFTTLYAHLIDERDPNFDIPKDSSGDPEGYVMVKTGDKVTQWTVLGRVGNTGFTSFSHTHFVIRKNGANQRIDEYFDPEKLEYRLMGDGASWKWDVPYQEDNPVSENVPLWKQLRPEQIRGFFGWVLIAVIILFVIRQTRKKRKLERREYPMPVRIAIKTVEIAIPVYVGIILLTLMIASTFGVFSGILEPMLSKINEVNRAVSFISDITGRDFHIGSHVSVAEASEVNVSQDSLMAPVWGWPCSGGGPGTLGNGCTPSELISLGKDWANELSDKTGKPATAVLIPVVDNSFSISDAEALVVEAHKKNVLVIIDTAADLNRLRDAIQRLTPLGLDGIALDHEHNESITGDQVRAIAEEFAQARADAGLKGDGILIVWDYLHRMRNPKVINGISGIETVVINDGYGGSVTKIESLRITKSTFGTDNDRTGIMYFDRRWPVNSACSSFGKSSGFDCQTWSSMFNSYDILGQIRWHAQQ